LFVSSLDCRRVDGLPTGPRTARVFVRYQHDADLSSSWRTEYKREKNLSSWRITSRLWDPHIEANS